MSEESKPVTAALEVERVLEAARDSVTDDMVARLAENVSQALELLDRVNRSGVDRAIPALADLVNNGDLDRLVKLARVYGSAEDALTDDMVGRLVEAAGGGLDLLDRINRADLARAIPAIARMVHDGDLDRLVSLARVYGSAEDALTDEMVGRLAEAVGGGLDLLDRVNRSQLGRALPVISRLVETGDLDRVADMVRLVGAAEDALTDDMVGRLAETVGEALGVLDRLNRSGVGKLVDILDRLNSTGALDRLASALPKLADHLDLLEDLARSVDDAARDVETGPAADGGIVPLLRMMRDPENQEVLQFAFSLGRRMQARRANRGG